MRINRRGFTLIEIMIVVLIIAVILAVAVPNLLMARDNASTRGCISNLRQILHAKQMYSMEPSVANDCEVTWDNLLPYLRGGQPNCPGGGTYELSTVEADVTCSKPAHRLY